MREPGTPAARLTGRHAVVTAGGSGIGEATARLLAAQGAAVIVTDREEALVDGVAASIRAQGGTARSLRVDVREDGDFERLAGFVDRELGRLDILVSNAGGTLGRYVRILEASPQYWDDMMDLNLRSTFMLCRALIPLMRDGGSIITIASIGALVSKSGFGVYSTAKSALIRLTQSIASDYASDGIRANVVCPGMIETDAIARMLSRAEDPHAARETQAARVPLGRLGLPADIAATVSFLASDDSAYMTGTVQVVDGGTMVAPT